MDRYVIRYHDVNKRNIVPLQLKIKNFCCEIDTYTNNNRVMFIYSDDKKLFRKCREIWNKITELIGINNAPDFLKNTIDDDANELIMVDVHKNISFVGGNYRNKLIILTVCSCHVTYAFQSECTLYSCLNVKELLARSRREI